MRTLKLTHEQIDLINNALKNEYFQRLKLIENNPHILNTETKQQIIKDADLYAELQSQINESKLDI